jgi:hypothetical protein
MAPNSALQYEIEGYCVLELANVTPRVLELLRVTKLLDLFS